MYFLKIRLKPHHFTLFLLLTLGMCVGHFISFSFIPDGSRTRSLLVGSSVTWLSLLNITAMSRNNFQSSCLGSFWLDWAIITSPTSDYLRTAHLIESTGPSVNTVQYPTWIIGLPHVFCPGLHAPGFSVSNNLTSFVRIVQRQYVIEKMPKECTSNYSTPSCEGKC